MWWSCWFTVCPLSFEVTVTKATICWSYFTNVESGFVFKWPNMIYFTQFTLRILHNRSWRIYIPKNIPNRFTSPLNGTNDVICRVIWCHLLFLSYQFSIFDEIGGWQPCTGLRKMFCFQRLLDYSNLLLPPQSRSRDKQRCSRRPQCHGRENDIHINNSVA